MLKYKESHNIVNKNVSQLKCMSHFSTLAKPELWQRVSYIMKN